VLYQLVQKRHHVAVQRLRVNVVALRKHVENVADAARLTQHVPDFATDLVEAEIRATAYAEDNGAGSEVGRSRLAVANKNTVDRDAQSCHVPLFYDEGTAPRAIIPPSEQIAEMPTRRKTPA